MRCFFLLCCLMTAFACSAGTAKESRQEAEYYVAVYARHYNMPVEFVRAVIEQESGWKRCVISSKGAVGLMQLMPATAARLNVSDRCDIRQNISGGVRYLAWLAAKFHRDLRLVAAAYYVGEHAIAMRGLAHSAVAQSRPNDLPALLVAPSEIVLPAGDTSALSVVDKAGRPVADVQWSINPQIANLQQENGEVLVQGREAGRATLTAIANHQSATAVITVVTEPRLAPATVH